MSNQISLGESRGRRWRAPRRAIGNSPAHQPTFADGKPFVASAPGLAAAKDKTLFTPGPLTTSLPVKQAMLQDVGSWHFEFNAVVASVRNRILGLANLSPEAGYETILLQG